MIKFEEEMVRLQKPVHFAVPVEDFGTERLIFTRIQKVVFNPPVTVVYWNDRSKTVVKCAADETFDKEKGLAMAICKHFYGDEFHKIFRKYAKPDAASNPTRHGHWELEGRFRTCSVCHATHLKEFVYNDETDEWDLVPMNYCPYCGAIMDEEVEK